MNTPEGWKLVPVEPTEKMICFGIEAYNGKCEESYAAMLAAAPMPPACSECNGTGEIDSGGTMPWGDPAMVACYKCNPTPTPPAQPNQWQEAVLNECMAIEGCYKEADPTGTVKCLIDWHVANEREQQVAAQEDEPQLTSRVPYREAYQRGYEAATSVKKEQEDDDDLSFDNDANFMLYWNELRSKQYDDAEEFTYEKWKRREMVRRAKKGNDKLRKAAEELDKFINDGMHFGESAYEKEMIRLVGNLHSALEEKSDA